MNAPAPVDGAGFGTGPAVETGTAICTTASQTGNATTDCETTSTGPHNETSIALNPTNPLNMIAVRTIISLRSTRAGTSPRPSSRAHT